jgi:hypothetical protein
MKIGNWGRVAFAAMALAVAAVSGSARVPGQHGIRENVPKEYADRYAKWKSELMSTEYGRELWAKYAERKDFLLTVTVSRERKFGAGTDDFEWDGDGKLVAATITLGKDLERGFPSPVYYPVMNSLATYDGLYQIDGNILAGAKIAHELGHVEQTSAADAKAFQQQNKLIANYYRIFLKNRFDTDDPRLVAIVKELGATPVEIWESREYWSEVDALRYLNERIGGEAFHCSVFDRMRRNIATYAGSYGDRFSGLIVQSGCRG